jgi:hypothetical protein
MSTKTKTIKKIKAFLVKIIEKEFLRNWFTKTIWTIPMITKRV